MIHNRTIYILFFRFTKPGQDFFAMIRLLTLTLLIPIALAFDGYLARDIFEYRIDTFSEWLVVVVIIIVIVGIMLGELGKKHRPITFDDPPD